MQLPSAELMTLTPLAVDLAVGTPVGEFVVERKLDEGGMATVYGAVHPVIGKRAAIKVLSATMSADRVQVLRFVQEARAVNEIGHPNIVEVFGFGELPDGRWYFMMEWLKGETLFHRMSGGRLPLEEILHIADLVCEALEAAHDKGIVHRDLKPANVFLVPVRGQLATPKLLDFGVAKLMMSERDPGIAGPQTLSGQVVGTPSYISPEQARGLPVDGRTDLYALGVMLYEMVLGALPFDATDPAELLNLHISSPPLPPHSIWPEVPPALEAVILGLLEKDRDRRPTAREVRAALDAMRSKPALSPTHVTLPVAFDAATPPIGARRARFVRWTVVTCVVVATCIVGSALARRRWWTQAPSAPVASPTTSRAEARREVHIPPADAVGGAAEPAAEPAANHGSEPVTKPAAERRGHDTRGTGRPRGASRRADPDYLVDPFAGRAR